MNGWRWAGLVIGAVALMAAMTLTLAEVTIARITIANETLVSNVKCGTIVGPSFDDGLPPITELVVEPTAEIVAQRTQYSVAAQIACDGARGVRTYLVVGLAGLGLVLLLTSGPPRVGPSTT